MTRGYERAAAGAGGDELSQSEARAGVETAVLERPAGARIRPAGSSESAFRLGVSGRAAFRSCESVTQPSGSVLPPAAGSMASRARRVAVASFRKAGCTAGAPAAARPGRHGLHAPGSRASRSPLTRVAPRARGESSHCMA